MVNPEQQTSPMVPHSAETQSEEKVASDTNQALRVEETSLPARSSKFLNERSGNEVIFSG